MKIKRRRDRYKGYSSWLPFSGGRSTNTITSQQLLYVFLLIAGGVSLLTWLLIHTKGSA